MKRLALLPLLIVMTLPLCAQQNGGTGELELPDLISAMTVNNPAYMSAKSGIESAHAGRNESMAAFGPQLKVEVPLAGTDILEKRFNSSTSFRDKIDISAEPGAEFSMMLPGAGVFQAVISNQISSGSIGESTYSLYPAADASFYNRLKFSIGISQPLYFGGDAYAAAINRIETSHEDALNTYRDKLNSVVTTAAGDYYRLKQAWYRLNLVQSRVEADRELLKKVQREFELGLHTKSRLTEAETSLLKSEADLLKAERELESVRRLINAVYSPDNTDISGPEISAIDSPALPFQELADRAEAASPSVASIKASIEDMKASKIIADKNSAPVLSAGGNFSIYNGLNNEESSKDLSFSVGVSAKALDGGESASRNSRIDNSISELESRLVYERTLLAERIRGLMDTIELSDKLDGIYRMQEKAALESYERGLLDLEMGQITRKQLFDIQLDLENSRLVVQSNLIERNKALLDLYRTTGEDLAVILTR